MSDNTNEKENSNPVLVEKIEQILSTVTDIKNTLNRHDDKINSFEVKLALQEQKDNNLQESIDKLEKKNDDTKKWLLGCIGTIAGGLILAICKFFLGV